MRGRWSYSKYAARRFGGRRYSRQRVGPGSKRSAYLKGTSWLCNVYATPSDFLEVKARDDLMSRINIIQRALPSDPYTLRLNTGLAAFRGDMWRWDRVDGKGTYTSEGYQYLCNVCSGLGVSSAVINMRPPMNNWKLDVKMIYGAALPELVTAKKDGNPLLTTYSGANNVIQWGQYGQMYDRYFVEYIVFEYVPSCSRMTDGQVTMLWNDNPTDPIPSTMGQFLTNTRCITTQVYNKARLVVRPRRWLWTCPQAGNTGVRSFSVRNQNVTAIPFTDRTVDCGWFAVCARSSKPDYFSAGTIRVSYGIRFSKPSINLEFIQPTAEVKADGTTVNGLVPARELIQPAMPAVQRAPPTNSLFLSSSNVDVQFVEERGLMGRADDDYQGVDVPQIDPNPQVGSLVMGGGGNPQTVDDQYGSNYIGNPMYYYADTCSGTGGDGGGGPGPGPGPEPDIPDDPVPPEPDVPVSSMKAYVVMRTSPFYRPGDAGNTVGVVKVGSSSYWPPVDPATLPGEQYGQSFTDLGKSWPAGSSGATPVTPSSVVGLVTMIDNDANMRSPKPGQVVALFGTNVTYTQKDLDSKTKDLTWPKNRFLYHTGVSWSTVSPLRLTTGTYVSSFSSSPNQFYLAGVWQNHASPSVTEAFYYYSGIMHDFMFMFLPQFSAYGVTYYGTEAYGVFRRFSTNLFGYTSDTSSFGTASSSSSIVCVSSLSVPIGDGSSGNPIDVSDNPTSSNFNVWSISSGIPSKLGVFISMHLAFTRVATPFILQTRAYMSVTRGSTGGDALCALWGTGPSPSTATKITWPPTIGAVGSSTVFASGLHEQFLDAFSTYNGLGDEHASDDLQAYTTKGLAYALSFTCDVSTVSGGGSFFFVPSVMFHLADAESTGLVINNFAGYSTDFETLDFTSGTPQDPSRASYYFVAGAQFFIISMKCVVYDADAAPRGLSNEQLGQYLVDHPSSVVMASGM